jgi:hypothetical protein
MRKHISWHDPFTGKLCRYAGPIDKANAVYERLKRRGVFASVAYDGDWITAV